MLHSIFNFDIISFLCVCGVGAVWLSFIQLSEVSMMSAASSQSEKVKSTSKRTEAGGGFSVLGVGGKASASFGKATSTGSLKVNLLLYLVVHTRKRHVCTQKNNL